MVLVLVFLGSGSGYLAWRGKFISNISAVPALRLGGWLFSSGRSGGAAAAAAVVVNEAEENGPNRMEDPRSGSTAATGSSRSVSPQRPTKSGVIRSWTLWCSSYGSIKTSDGKPCRT